MDLPFNVQITEGVLIITLNRPKANAINVDTSKFLYQCFKQLQDEASLRVAIITGAGDRFFSAGWDLNGAVAGEAIDADHGPGGFAGLTEYFSLTKPVIAAVNGYAVGGGFELALAADLIVAADHAEFGLPEVTIGMIPDAGGILRLPKKLPRVIANELLLTGRRMKAQEAFQWGLVNKVVSLEELMPTAMSLAKQICQTAPLATLAVKEVLAHTEHLAVKDGYQKIRSETLPHYLKMLTSEDVKEGPKAFTEKREPVWKNK